MQSRAISVAQYLSELPAERRAALEAVRAVITRNLDPDFEEGMQYGMIGYYVPHRVFTAGYHCDPKQPLPFAALAAQKNYMAIYLMHLYADGEEERWFRRAWVAGGRKLDMGKCCVRFKSLADVPLEVLGVAIRRVSAREYVQQYQQRLQHAPAGAASRKAQKTARRKSPGRGRGTAGK